MTKEPKLDQVELPGDLLAAASALGAVLLLRVAPRCGVVLTMCASVASSEHVCAFVTIQKLTSTYPNMSTW